MFHWIIWASKLDQIKSLGSFQINWKIPNLKDNLENFQIARKVSRWLGQFPYGLASFQMTWNVSMLWTVFFHHGLESFQVVWEVSSYSGQLSLNLTPLPLTVKLNVKYTCIFLRLPVATVRGDILWSEIETWSFPLFYRSIKHIVRTQFPSSSNILKEQIPAGIYGNYPILQVKFWTSKNWSQANHCALEITGCVIEKNMYKVYII